VSGVLLAIALVAATALFSAAAARWERSALAVSTAASVAACVLGATSSLRMLLGGDRFSWRGAWPLPVGELHLGVDPLSAFFLLCIFTVSGLAALYGGSYMRAYLGRRRIAPALIFFHLLVASMAVLVVARDGILFLVAWEVLSLSSFFLVTFENDREDVRRAGLTYLVASQLGVVFLFVLFALLSRGTGRYDFDAFASAPAAAGIATVGFWLALVGFGTKSGFWPVHVWLPDAHPAAPSHVSALMSGVMIKMGIYGLLRTLTFLGPPPVWWGVVLLAVGAVSGIAGVLHALAQHDVKRLLAYHSVENIGIIAMGLGLGVLGQARHDSAVAFLGFSGALLHVLNHGLFKGLLFQAAGSVVHATGTRELDSLGGLARRMPWTASSFLLGSAAICALPPLNGFVSEWLIYVGAFRAGSRLAGSAAVSAIAVIAALALIGGLAAACFAKAYGVVFLGEPRTASASLAHEAGTGMRAAMLAGAAACILLGVWPAGALALVAPAASVLAPGSWAGAGGESLSSISTAAGALLGAIALVAVFRRVRVSRRPARRAATWGCGYAQATPRMQYTAASFAEPLIEPFAAAMNVHVEREGPAGPFPRHARYEEHLGDLAGERLLVPAARRIVRGLTSIRVLQQGRVQPYLLYIAGTLVALLVWQLLETAR
jgi:hydrogenase-4 component B